MNRIAIRLTLSLLLLTLLSACGFQPRGQVTQLQSVPQPLYVAGVEPYSPLGKELRRQLSLAGASLTVDGGTAVVTVIVCCELVTMRLRWVRGLSRATP